MQVNFAKKGLCFVLLMSLHGVGITDNASIPEIKSAWTRKPLVHGQHQMIVTNHPLASQAAKKILQKGGNATDASIAAAFVLGVTEPQSSGLGGGGYALTYQRSKHRLMTYDGRERAPNAATPQWFLDKKGQPLGFEKAWLSPKSVGVPGEVAMLYLMHQKEGRLPWEVLLQPAITLAHDGFPMQRRLYTLLSKDQSILVKHKQVRSIYFTSQGQIKSVGAWIKNPALAQVLKQIARHPRSFYRGKIAQDMIKTLNELGEQKLYQPQDFETYTALMKPALCDTYRHYKICTVPPTAGGISVLELLKLYAIKYVGRTFTDEEWVYTFLEVSKLIFADRNRYVADPSLVQPSIMGLLSDHYIRARSQCISSKAIQGEVQPGILPNIQWNYAADNQFQRYGTTSLTIVDAEGNAVAMSLSIEHQFGSHIMVDGFFLNNELTDFSFTPKNANGQWIANRVEPGKRPRSAMSPLMVFNSNHQLDVLAASPGGSAIICYVAKNIIQMLDFDWNPARSAASGNLCVIGNQVTLEADSDLTSFGPFLEKRGESIQFSDQLTSGETNIKRDPKGGWWGGADPRREGLAIGD